MTTYHVSENSNNHCDQKCSGSFEFFELLLTNDVVAASKVEVVSKMKDDTAEIRPGLPNLFTPTPLHPEPVLIKCSETKIRTGEAYNLKDPAF